jgi:glutathione synthase/RimK-type ligase-like ATP-grasp enzyme
MKYDEYLKLLEILAASKVPVFNSVDILKWNSNKKYLNELQSEGFDIIPTIFNINKSNDSFSKAILKGWEKMVLKPLISGGSYHTFLIDGEDEILFNQLIKKHYVNRPYMLQEFIPEISTGEISTITFSNGFSYSVTKVPPQGEYRVQVDYGGIYHYGSVDPEIKKICDRITNRFEEKLLYQRVDGLWRNGKFLIMEVELIEPDLYLNLNKDALNNWVDSLIDIIE